MPLLMWHSPYFTWNLNAVSQLEATQSFVWHNIFVCGGFTVQILPRNVSLYGRLPFFLSSCYKMSLYYFDVCAMRLVLFFFYPDQQMHTGNTNIRRVHYIQNNLTSLITFRSPCIIYINSYQGYTHTTARTVCTSTTLTTFTYFNYNSWHSSQRFIDCILSSTVKKI